MLIRIPTVLDAAELARCRALALSGDWADGRLTAGTQSAQVKNNRQLPEGAAARAAREVVLAALARNAIFFTAALPKKIYPPLFNRYDGRANAFGNHIDNAVRTFAPTGQHVRTDLSATLFLSAPADYEGGELVIEDTYGAHRVKLAAGDMVLYPASSVHRVEPVTAGSRLASFFWIESMVRDDAQRRVLFDLDTSIIELRAATPSGGAASKDDKGASDGGEPGDMNSVGDSEAVVRLTGCYHNLLRMWADT